MALKDSVDASSISNLNIMCRRPQLLVAPPQRRHVEEIVRRSGARIFTWSHVTPPFYNPDRHRVEIGWPFSERLWATLCAYIAGFEWYEREGEPPSLQPFLDAAENAPLRRLFDWALEAAIETSPETRTPWPTNTPRPAKPSGLIGSRDALERLAGDGLVETFEGRVSRTWQRATAWALLHEIGHVWYGHRSTFEMDPAALGGTAPWSLPPRQVAINQEQEADHFASTILGLPKSATDDPLATLGVVGLLVMLASTELGPDGARRTPRSPLHPMLRLRRFLFTFQEHGDLAWRAASVFLDLDRRAQGLSATSAPFGTDQHLAEIYAAAGGPVVGDRPSQAHLFP